MRTHTGEKTFKYKFCEKSFSNKGNLTIHVRTHTGEKPFKCNLSENSFSPKGDLTRHVRIHTPERSYSSANFVRKVFPTKEI